MHEWSRSEWQKANSFILTPKICLTSTILYIVITTQVEKVYYTEHLKLRLKARNIHEELPRKILNEADERYWDTATSKWIALKKVRYKNKEREFIVVYEKTDEIINLITVHPIKTYQKYHRIKTGRWKEWERI